MLSVRLRAFQPQKNETPWTIFFDTIFVIVFFSKKILAIRISFATFFLQLFSQQIIAETFTNECYLYHYIYANQQELVH